MSRCERGGRGAAILVVAATLLGSGPAQGSGSTTMLDTLRAHHQELERCFLELGPDEPSRVTISFVVNGEGYGVAAVILRGQGGLDSPGLCLVDQFMLRPGIHFEDRRLRGRRLEAELIFSPRGQPRLQIAAPRQGR